MKASPARMSGSGRPRNALAYLAAPVTLALVVFFPVTRAYFHGDDFVHLIEVVNKGVTAVVFRPYMSHLYVLPTLVYWGLWETVGLRAAPYLWVGLLLHLLNVALVFTAVRRLTGGLRIASLAALVWGTWPCHEGSLAWFCVHAHVIAGTTTLLVVNGLAAAMERESIDWRPAALWAGLLLVGATSFGTGIAVAVVFPLMAALCVGRRLTKGAVGVLVALPLLVFGLFIAAHIAYPITPGPRPEMSLRTFLTRPSTALPMWIHLWAFGVGSLLVGFFSAPSPIPTHPLRYPSPGIYVIAAAVAVLGAIALLRSPPVRRRWFAALVVAVAAAYGSLSVGRAVLSLQIFHLPASVMASSVCRYHYLPSIGVILILALVADVLAKDLSVSERGKDLLLLIGFAIVLAAFMRSGWKIDLHPESRDAVSAVLKEAEAAARAAPQGATVYILDRQFEPFFIFQPEFTSAGVFSLLFPADILEARHVRYVQADAKIRGHIPPGSRLSRLVVGSDAVPAIP